MTDLERHEKDAGVVDIASQDESNTIDKDVEKKLIQKTDIILMPGLALAYFTHTLDRANLGNAKTGGLEADLNLHGNQFSLLLVLFYIPYALLNVPWTMAAKRFNPAVVIPCIMAAWGALAMAASAAKGFGGILACRILMGAVEAAFLPCAIFYCSLFYTRKELAFRTSIFCMMGFIAGAVSGLIAWSVFQWDKKLKGWQYLFIIEGALTVGIALVLLVIFPRSPQKSRWFTEEEKRISQLRLEQDSQDHKRGFQWADAKQELESWPIWVFAAMALLYGVGVASSSNFLPTLIKRLTISSAKANLYTVGPNLTAAAIQLTTTWISDHFQQRATIAAGAVFVSLLAWILLATLDLVNHTKVGYFLTYLITFGTFTPGVIVPVWLASNVHTTTGRAVALGLSFGSQNLGGIVSSMVFREQDAPIYKPALLTVACCQASFIVICLCVRQYYSRLNRRLDRGELGCVRNMETRLDYRYAI